MVHSIPDLKMPRCWPGYAIEYDSIDPTELQRTLETKKIARFVPGRTDQRHQAVMKKRRAKG